MKQGPAPEIDAAISRAVEAMQSTLWDNRHTWSRKSFAAFMLVHTTLEDVEDV